MNGGNGKLFTKKLGDLLTEAATGFACGQRNPDGVIQLRMNNVTRRGELDWSSFIRVPVDERLLDDYVLHTGDVLFNNTNSTELVGKTAFFDGFHEPVVFSNHFTRLRTKADALAPDFLALWLHSQWQVGLFARVCDRWIGQSAVQRNKLLSLEIPLPPLEEQRRIAARLREQLSIVTEARTALEAQLAAAESLPAAHLRAVFESEEAKRWPYAMLGELCVDGGQYGTSEKSNTITDGMPVLRMGNISEGKIVWENLKYADRSNSDCAKYLLCVGDLIFNRTNSVELVGKSAVFDGEREAIFASYLIRFRMLPDRANPHFVCAFINSAQGRRFIEANMVRAIGQANVSASTMQRMEIPAPPIAEQNAIAAKLEATYAEVRALRQTIATQLSELEKLPAALLRSAFNPNGT